MKTKDEKAQNKPKHPGGRPSHYTEEKGDRICEIISTTSLGLPTICKSFTDPDLPKHASTVRKWRLDHEGFNAKYARAKLAQADILAEECLEISDDSTQETVTMDKLRIDTRKWLASKLLPKQYGDKMLLEQKTEENEKLKEELCVLREELDKNNKREF